MKFYLHYYTSIEEGSLGVLKHAGVNANYA